MNINLVKCHAEKPISDNFEDVYRHYYSLVYVLTRTSADMDIDTAHTKIRMEYKHNALKYNPDKNEGKEE